MPFRFTDVQQITVLDEEGKFVIRYRWLKPSVINTVVIPMALLGLPTFVILWGEASLEETSDWAGAIFLSTIWLLAIYSYLAHILNSTSVAINEQSLTLRHMPLPWRGQQTLQRKQIKWLEPRRRRESQMEDGGEIITITYDVIAVLEGNSIPLIQRTSSFDQAKEIAQLANRKLELLSST